MEYRIRFIKGELSGQSFTLGHHALNVGRSRSNDVVLQSKYVSHRHVRMTVEPTGVLLENLSSQLTTIDGNRLSLGQNVPLKAGQSVQLGAETEFVLEAFAGEPAATKTSSLGFSAFGATQGTGNQEATSGGATEGFNQGTRTNGEATASATSSDETGGATAGSTTATRSSGQTGTATGTSATRSSSGTPYSRGKTPPPRVVPSAQSSAPAPEQTQEQHTRLATPEEIEDEKREEENRRKLRFVAYAGAGLAFIGLMGAFYYFFLYKAPERTLDWPVKNGVQQKSRAIDTPLNFPGLEKMFYISYPLCDFTVKGKPSGNVALDLMTGIGREGNVPLYIKVEFAQNTQLLHEDRETSFSNWMKEKAEGPTGWSFETSRQSVTFWGADNGIPHIDVDYTRKEGTEHRFGRVSYCRYGDVEFAIIKELPSNERWRGEYFLTNALIGFTADCIFNHWEGMAEPLGISVSEALAEAEKLLEGKSPKYWNRIALLLRTVLCNSKGKDAPEIYGKAKRLLGQMRREQTKWYNNQNLAYQEYRTLKDKNKMEAVKKESREVFNSPDDARYFKVRRNKWDWRR